MMERTLFSAVGCLRCKLVREVMDDLGLPYAEKDINGDGKDDFRKFYATNRSSIYRDERGVEFPVLVDGDQVHQGLGMAVAHLRSGGRLKGFFGHGTLSKEWLDGVHVSGGHSTRADEFIDALKYLKRKGVKLALDTWGRNADILEMVLASGVADRMTMRVLGPPEVYAGMFQGEPDIGGIEKSIELTARFPEYHYQLCVAPVGSYTTPEEAGIMAKWIKDVTGSMKEPCLLRLIHGDDMPAGTREPEDAPPETLFKHRTAARRFQVFTEIDKQ